MLNIHVVLIAFSVPLIGFEMNDLQGCIRGNSRYYYIALHIPDLVWTTDFKLIGESVENRIPTVTHVESSIFYFRFI